MRKRSCLIRTHPPPLPLQSLFLYYKMEAETGENIMITINFVIPVYNEEKRLTKTFEALEGLQLPCGLQLEKIIFVNDGSTDNTLRSIRKAIPAIEKKLKVKGEVISYTQNKGKGFAIRTGMLASSSDYTIFFDADMSTPLSQIEKLIPVMKKGTHVIIGTRKNGKSTVIDHQPFYRESLGKMFTLFTNTVLGTHFTDFTCGFKAISAQAKNDIFKRTKINRWSYDAEVLFLTKTLGYSYKEIPVTWSNDVNSKVRLFVDMPRSLFELMSIRNAKIVLPSVATGENFATVPNTIQ